MSKSEEKAKEYAELRYCQHCRLKDNCNYKKSCNDYNDSIKIFELGYMQAKTDLSTENAQLKEALRETVTELEKVFTDWYPYDDEVEIHKIGSIVEKAKQILNKE